VTPSPVLTIAEIQAMLQAVYMVGNVDAIDALDGTATIRTYGVTTSDPYTLQYQGAIGAVTAGPSVAGGKTYSTTYYPYIDVDPVTLLPSSFDATPLYLDSLNSDDHPYRISLNRAVTTPASGGGTATSGSTGGGYGGGGTDGTGDRLHLV
jgi:hypothetical protein